MFGENKIAVVVPAHNESRLIARAVAVVPDFVDDIIVVDDASDDGTSDVLKREVKRPGLHFLRHEVNLGVGGAIVSGYRQALGLGADIVVVMAGDAQMDPADLPRLITPIITGDADYSKGDRLSWPGVATEMPIVRYFGNHALTRLTRFTSGYRQLRDSQCGYTAVSARALNRINLQGLYQRYGFPNDLLAHLKSANVRLAQVQVRPIYGSEQSEISWFTAFVRVPLVLMRSFAGRRRRQMFSDKLGPLTV
jgi:glycosyltransferase involved in cell wall biosynthesis